MPKPQPATRLRTCRACGKQFEYPLKGSPATRFHCEDCVDHPARNPQTRRTPFHPPAKTRANSKAPRTKSRHRTGTGAGTGERGVMFGFPSGPFRPLCPFTAATKPRIPRASFNLRQRHPLEQPLDKLRLRPVHLLPRLRQSQPFRPVNLREFLNIPGARRPFASGTCCCAPGRRNPLRRPTHGPSCRLSASLIPVPGQAPGGGSPPSSSRNSIRARSIKSSPTSTSPFRNTPYPGILLPENRPAWVYEQHFDLPSPAPVKQQPRADHATHLLRLDRYRRTDLSRLEEMLRHGRRHSHAAVRCGVAGQMTRMHPIPTRESQEKRHLRPLE